MFCLQTSGNVIPRPAMWASGLGAITMNAAAIRTLITRLTAAAAIVTAMMLIQGPLLKRSTLACHRFLLAANTWIQNTIPSPWQSSFVILFAGVSCRHGHCNRCFSKRRMRDGRRAGATKQTQKICWMSISQMKDKLLSTMASQSKLWAN